MNNRYARIATVSAIALLIGFGIVGLRPSEAVPSTAAVKTLDNLQTAFNGESNAHARYLEFAKKADEDGFGQVASMFRAAARAEQIHAANHGVVIKQMGGEPKVDLQKAEVKSTRENLEAAIKGESYERDTMYPQFLGDARKEGNKAALETLNFARTAEAEHAKLYAALLGNLDTLKGSAAKTMFVCTVCGYTTTVLDFAKCPSCFNPKDKYVQVS